MKDIPIYNCNIIILLQIICLLFTVICNSHLDSLLASNYSKQMAMSVGCMEIGKDSIDGPILKVQKLHSIKQRVLNDK